MKKLLFLILILCTSFLQSQDKFTISGIIKDKSNGETIIGASVFLKNTTIGSITNDYGFFSISAPKSSYTLVISYLGYKDVVKQVDLNENLKINLEIEEDDDVLDEVVITSEKNEITNIRAPQMSVAKIKINTIKKIPVVFGEVDVVKALQLLPGVTNNGEGSSGFNVRGGSSDQNLVLLDEAIIYNSSHLFGFFSIFNADALKDVKLYKGMIPANFGGRSSSVLDVRQKEGNKKNLAITGGIGTISSRLAIEAPLFKGKGSFLAAGRASYIHLFLELAGQENSANFYDLNLKTNYEINKKNKLYLSSYFGRDIFNISNAFKTNYGNSSGTLRWNHLFNDKLFSNLSLVYSKYEYDLNIDLFGFNWVSFITNYNIKYDLKYYLNDNIKLDFGSNTIYYDFDPGTISPSDDGSAFNLLVLDKKKALESGVYINAEHKLSDKLSAQYGVRASSFLRLGGQSLLEYENNQPLVYNELLGLYEAGNPTGEVSYEKHESIKDFVNLEPRFGMSYQLNDDSSVKAGYSKTTQYIHLLSNTTSASPLDVWAPSGKFIKPQQSNQYALGYFKTIDNKKYSLEVETYYKKINDVIDYIDGSDLIAKNNIEQEILSGETEAYGLEVLFRKNKGRFKGWLAYTLSKAVSKTPGGSAGGLGINNGEWYNAAYDKPHDISVTGTYDLNEKWSFGGNFILQSGRPVTYPNAQYVYEGLTIANYSERNTSRLPSYNRLDISATYTPSSTEKRWKGEWVFGIYNIYNRKNAASVSFAQNRGTGENEATRTSIFGIVPSVIYNFKF